MIQRIGKNRVRGTNHANVFEGIVPNGLFSPSINIVAANQDTSLGRWYL